MKNLYKKTIFVFLLFFLIRLVFPLQSSKKTVYDRDYNKWLKLVSYIITPTEKKIFLSLKTRKDKDAFIKLFWKQRDPTPGTDANEYKIELIKRFEYANKHFGRGTPKEGWQTDMGRIYIILGEPQKIERFDNINGLYPVIVWDYYGLNIPGIPKNINISFFKRNGFGEYVLYDPSADGPSALLANITTSFGRYEYRKIYKKIMKLAPQLVGPAFSVIPGRKSLIIPQVNNSIILSKVLESPQKTIDSNYANNFVKFKGVVNVEENYNLIKSELFYTIIKEPISGLYFLHFSYKPKKLSFDYSDEYDKYFNALTLSVIVKNKEKIIYQYDKKFSLSFTKQQFIEEVKPMGISIDDVFPIVKGDFDIVFLLRNSVNKEFSYIEKKIIVNDSNTPRLSPPILGYRILKPAQPVFRPFLIEPDKIISIDSENIFSLKDKIFFIIQSLNIKKGKIIVKINSREGYQKYNKTYSFNINSQNHKNDFIIINLAKNLFPAVFNVSSILYSESNIPLDTKETSFSISPLSFVNHPMEIMNGINLKDMPVYYYKTADIYRNMKKFNLAEKFYEKGFKENPKIYDELINYIDFLLSINSPEKADKIIKSLKTVKELAYEYNAYKGKILFLENDYGKALDFFLKANKYFDRDYNILALTGLCYLKLNNKKAAKKFFIKSLNINQQQPIIKKYIDNLK